MIMVAENVAKTILAFCNYLDNCGLFKQSDYVFKKFAKYNSTRAGKKKKRWSVNYPTHEGWGFLLHSRSYCYSVQRR